MLEFFNAHKMKFKLAGQIITILVILFGITKCLGHIVEEDRIERKHIRIIQNNSNFKVGDPVIIDSNGQRGYVIEKYCFRREGVCTYIVSIMDIEGEHQRVYLRDFELLKR